MSDHRSFSATQLAQLARCEQQSVFDRKHGAKRSQAWQRRAVEGQVVHARLHRDVTRPATKETHRMLIVGLVAAVLAALLLLALARGATPDDDALLPPELQGSTLAMSETRIARRRPVHVRGTPDEVWVKDGQRFIVETKSRAGGVYDGDRMQLAAYAYMLRTDGGPPLSPYGYIRFTGEAVRFAKVRLLNDDAVITAHRRLQKVSAGRVEPDFANQVAVCRGCGHQKRCPRNLIA